MREKKKCASAKSKVLVLATTSNPDKVDKRLMSSNMFYKQVRTGNPNEIERQKIVGLHLEKFLLKEEAATVCKYIAKETPDVVPLDLISIAIDSVDLAAQRGLLKT